MVYYAPQSFYLRISYSLKTWEKNWVLTYLVIRFLLWVKYLIKLSLHSFWDIPYPTPNRDKPRAQNPAMRFKEKLLRSVTALHMR